MFKTSLLPSLFSYAKYRYKDHDDGGRFKNLPVVVFPPVRGREIMLAKINVGFLLANLTVLILVLLFK